MHMRCAAGTLVLLFNILQLACILYTQSFLGFFSKSKCLHVLFLNCMVPRVDGWQQRQRDRGFVQPSVPMSRTLVMIHSLIMQPSWDVSLTSEAMMYNCIWLSWNSFTLWFTPVRMGRVVWPHYQVARFIRMPRGTPAWAKNGYGLYSLIRTNIWLISTMLVAICMQIF